MLRLPAVVFVLEQQGEMGVLEWGIMPLFPSESPVSGVFGFRVAPFPFTSHLPEKAAPDQGHAIYPWVCE